MAGKPVLLAAEFLRGAATLTRLRPLATALAIQPYRAWSMTEPADCTR
jgi:hypothetical protein